VWIVNEGLAQRQVNLAIFETYLSHAIIALHDAWAFRCRAIVLRSAAGGSQTLSRGILPRTHRRPSEWLSGHWGYSPMPRTWEPRWHVPAEAIRAAHILGIANENQVTNGLGASTAAEELRITRNVIAHSLPATWARLRRLEQNLGHTGRETPADFAVLRYRNVGGRHIERWVAELRGCLRAAAS
jgi:hypothetical protein